MAVSECIYSGGGGATIKLGSATPNSSGQFDCGVDDPDLLYLCLDRNANDWTMLYLKAGAFDSTYANNIYPIDSMGNSATTKSSKPTVSGSTVTIPNEGTFRSLAWKYVAIKM